MRAVTAAGPGSELARTRSNGLFEFRARHDFIDQPPIDRAFSFHPLLGGAEKVGMVAPHFSLVGDARQPAGARQYCKQRQFRQGDGGRAVIHQHDVVGRQCEFIAAAGSRAVDRADGLQAGILAQILDAVARLVGEFAEVDFVRMARAGEHADIGAGAEHPRLARPQHHHPHLRVLEAQPLNRIGKFDIDAKIVGVELELVAFEQPALLVDVEQQRGDIAVNVELPVPIPGRLSLEIDPCPAVGQRALGCVWRIAH